MAKNQDLQDTMILLEVLLFQYEELNTQANQVAHLLRRMNIGVNTCVGLYMGRSIYVLVGLLAILKAGGTYVPLDPEHPVARTLYQLQQTNTSLVLTQEHLSSRLTIYEGRILCLDSDPLIAQEATNNLDPINHIEDLAYIIYTSGSTGNPKGVMVRHQGIVNYTQAMSQLIAREPGLHFATVSTLAADLGNTAIFCSLFSPFT